jgi:tRNA A-37 threonylcarbamoyl transferase component Bud32
MGTRADPGAGVLVDVVLPERYEPIRRIARGGMATVWCAHDRTLDRRVAIKLLAERYAHDELAGRRFKREARAAARLSGHPNVVTIYDVGQAGADGDSMGRPFLVMEFLSGGTVADALRIRNLDRPAALRWLQQAAEALDYAHRRGVIHRDVKLANFLLDRERVLHVADFGIAQLGSEDTLTVSGEVLGTAAYLAPERALGQPATEASDRYALAVAAFELLVGERPFTAEHFAAQARQHVEEPPPAASQRNPELPRALDAVLARGMAKRPEERFPTALQLTDAIEEALGGEATTAAIARTAATRRMANAGPAPRPVAAQRQPWSAEAPVTRYGTTRRTSRTRVAVLGALAATLIGVAIAAAASGGFGGKGHSTAALKRPRHALAARPARKRTTTRPAARTQPPASSAARTPAARTPTTSTPSTSAPPPTPAGGADALESQGHALMAAGNYRDAVPILRKAVAESSPGSLTYAYALFDLGRSLRLSGDPRAAVPILWRRLQIPNQTSVVRSELRLALEALGQQASLSGGPKHGDQHQG